MTCLANRLHYSGHGQVRGHNRCTDDSQSELEVLLGWCGVGFSCHK